MCVERIIIVQSIITKLIQSFEKITGNTCFSAVSTFFF